MSRDFNGGRSMNRFGFFCVVLSVLLPAVAGAEIKTQTIDYKLGTLTMKGYLAYDDAVKTPRPGILICPEWWGLNDYPKGRARQLAGLGYVAFVADPYGDGQIATTMADAQRLSVVKNDRPTLRARANAALAVLAARPEVDPKKLGAIGYCFGGTMALELARSGADLAAVVSFHGGLDTPNPADAKNIKAKVLVCTGADDASVPPDQVSAFMKEMKDAKVDYAVEIYGGAVHAFTNPASDAVGNANIKYNAKADQRSWAAMNELFGEAFNPPAAPTGTK
jgi:dienelactone hydrolase